MDTVVYQLLMLMISVSACAFAVGYCVGLQDRHSGHRITTLVGERANLEARDYDFRGLDVQDPVPPHKRHRITC